MSDEQILLFILVFIALPLSFVPAAIAYRHELRAFWRRDPLKPVRTLPKRITDWFSHIENAGRVIVILALTFMVGGFLYVTSPEDRTLRKFIEEFYANGSSELLSIAITVFIIDRLSARRSEREAERREKADLILQMGSPDNGFAREAVRKLRARGWLKDGSLHGARLFRANLQKADLRGANLHRADLSGANLQEADLEDADLQGAILMEAKLQGANLWYADLQGAFLEAANLQGADLMGANLQGARLEDANLQGANLLFADLQGADLEDANLQGVYLTEANLQGAFLAKANLQGVYLTEANLQGANLWYADLQGADLSGVIFDESTTLPDGTGWHASVDMERFTAQG